jgi:predicted RNA binding protein YcfA (HicA-like mRNA interferase family)
VNDLDAALRDLKRDGYTVSMTKNNHRQVRSPAGRIVATVGLTPRSTYLAVRSLRSDIRRAGRNGQAPSTPKKGSAA